jgi:hypothetical protein
MGTAENQATKMRFEEIEGGPPEQMRLKCHCGNVIKKRRDAFLPGAHVVICLACSNTSSEVTLLSGETRAVTAASHRSPAG